jgi:hypothetical protein
MRLRRQKGDGMRRLFVTAVTALIVAAPPTAASADPIIQPLRCRIGDMTGIYVGGKCTYTYWP